MMKVTAWMLLATLLLLGGCGGGADTEVRTFALERMNHEDALALLTPYVGESGTITGQGGLITVRARPQEVDRIAQVIARYDGPPAQVRVQVHVLEGGNFDAASGLPFEATLRELLPYRGYRVVDDAEFLATEWSQFSRDGLGAFAIAGGVTDVRTDGPDSSATINLRVEGRSPERLGGHISGTVNAPIGETVVMATHRSGGAGPALVVALRADLIADGAPRAPASAAPANP